MPALEFRNVSKTFAQGGGRRLLGSLVLNQLLYRRANKGKTPFYALRDFSLSIEHGEGLGVVGGNGAGKSTLLALATGVSEPDEGEVRVDGRVVAVLDLGSGFHPDLTGAENLRLNASLLGVTRQRTDEFYDSVIEFAGIGDFIREPLRTYSLGMTLRLAFAVAVHLDPDILIIDEVIAVGDDAFQQKCMQRMMEFREKRKTIVLASHIAGTIRRMCDRAVWLDHGRIVMHGPAEEVLEAYHSGRRPA